MEKLLVTTSLLDSFEFAMNAPPSWKSRAMADLTGKVRREKMDFPDWVKKGIAFEDTVYRVCRKAKYLGKNEVTSGSDIFNELSTMCIGGAFQEVYKIITEVNGNYVEIYTKHDVNMPDRIFDIKTTLRWRGEDKYLKGWQHKVYTVAAKKAIFVYLVVTWEDTYSDKLKSFDIVPYYNELDSHPEKLKEIQNAISEMSLFFQNNGLWLDYCNVFSRNVKG